MTGVKYVKSSRSIFLSFFFVSIRNPLTLRSISVSISELSDYFEIEKLKEGTSTVIDVSRSMCSSRDVAYRRRGIFEISGKPCLKLLPIVSY